MVVLCVMATTTHGTDRNSMNNNKNMMDDFTGNVVSKSTSATVNPLPVDFEKQTVERELSNGGMVTGYGLREQAIKMSSYRTVLSSNHTVDAGGLVCNFRTLEGLG